MRREIRRVPANWDHPRKMFISGPGYQPMFNQTFATAVAEWKEAKRKWDAGEDPDQAKYGKGCESYADWAGECPDDPSYYRPWSDAEATWYQLWETVSEGSPVTPPFATLDELAQHLAKCGDEWDTQRGRSGWGIERAKAFCKVGWAPSFVMSEGRMQAGATAIANTELKKGTS
jgi:hypothetical protein